MTHLIVDLPTKDGDFPVRYVSLPEGNFLDNRGLTHHQMDDYFEKWGLPWSTIGYFISFL
jgi:hypothetical protein